MWVLYETVKYDIVMNKNAELPYHADCGRLTFDLLNFIHYIICHAHDSSFL